MAKIKLTKTELKHQQDSLKRFKRYLPTLQLKKQQLQLETRRTRDELEKLAQQEQAHRKKVSAWMGLLSEDLREMAADVLEVVAWETGQRNIAGVQTPVFEKLVYKREVVDLFTTPIVLDDIIEAVKTGSEYRLHHRLLQEQLDALEDELRVTTQRVNLFEKVKIPEAEVNIRTIRISLGDEQASAVGRAKIAKAKAAAAAL